MASSPFFTDEAQLNQASADHPFLPSKKKRNLPGNPNPDAEVIALSPRTLMATNRFVCEVCSKGFQREQNLQLHRRGHNLPWKLKQKSGGKETRRRVYLCPEPSCVHHDPSRALGDLTGIKKHFSRKHGEKKWKCEKCAKRYAVQSDWKAHSKTCGTREYRCDCGTLFSRRDSFITHRAFCDALAQESARQLPSHNPFYRNSINANFASEHNFSYAPPLIMDHDSSLEAKQPPNSWHGLMHLPLEHNVFMNLSYAPPLISDHEQASAATMFCEGEACGLPQMSATALLQKAAQIGATTSSSPAFRTGSNLMDVMTSFAFGRGKEEAQGASYHTSASDDALTRDFLGMRSFSHLDTFPDELSKSVAMSNRFFHTNTQE